MARSFSRRLCMNCVQPACASVCPVGALQKTALGPVVYDADKCMGCRYCMQACPFQVPSYEWSALLPRMRKCDMCYERQSQGKVTACSEACPVGATKTGDRDALIAEAQPADRGEAGAVLQQDLWHPGGRRHIGVVPFGRAVRADRIAHQRPQEAAAGDHLARPGIAARRRLDRRCPAGRHLVDIESQGGSCQSGGPPQMKLPKLTVWRAIFAAILFSGVYATYLRIFKGLGGSTNLSDQFPWGIWIGFDVMCGVGLAAGGFTLVAIVHIFNIEKYRPVLRPAILTAFLGYLLVVVGLLYDLGRPDRLWHPLVMWNPHSVMFEVAWCVTLYSTVLFLEFIPVVFERWGWHKPTAWIHRISVPLMILGILLSTLHQSSIGSLFLIVPSKLYPLWYTPAAAAAVLRLGDRGRDGDDDLRIVAQQPGVRTRSRTAAARQPRAGAGRHHERVPVDPLARPGASRRVPAALAEPDGDVALRPGDGADDRADDPAVSAQGPAESRRAVCLRGDGGLRLRRQPPECRDDWHGSRLRHALLPEVERGLDYAFDHRRRFRDVPRDRRLFPHFRAAFG